MGTIQNRSMTLGLLVLGMTLSGFISCSKAVDSVGKNTASVQPDGSTNSGSGSGDSTAAATQKDLEDQKITFENLLNELQKKVDAGDKKLQDQIDEVKKGLADLSDRIDASLAALDIRLKAAEKTLSDLLASSSAQGSEIEKLKAAQASQKTDIEKLIVAQDLQSKSIEKLIADYNTLKNAVDGLKETVRLLGLDQDGFKLSLAALGTKYTDLKDVLKIVKDDLAGLTLTVDGINTKLTNHITAYNLKVQQLSDRITSEVSDIRAAMLVDKAGLQLQITSLNDEVTRLRTYSQTMKTTFEDEIKLLKAKDISHDAAIAAAILKAETELATAVAAELTAKGLLQTQITNLTSEVARIKTFAEATDAMTRLNAGNISTLRTDLNAAKVEFQTQIDALKVDFEAKLAIVRDSVAAVAGQLGPIREQLQDVAGRLAQTEARVLALGDAVSTLFLNIVKTSGEIAKLQAVLAPYYTDLETEMLSVIHFGHLVERDAIDSIDVVQKAAGVDIVALNNEFKTAVGAACINSIDPEGLFNSVVGFEWFFHMFHNVYLNDLIYGVRSGDPSIDKIFFSKTPLVKSTGLVSFLVTGMFEPYSIRASVDCSAAIKSWSQQTLYGASAISVAIRAAIARNALVSANVGQLFNAIARLNGKATDFMQRLTTYLATFMASENAVVAYLTTAPVGGSSPLSQLAFILLDRVKEQAIFNELKDQRDSIYTVARKVSTSAGGSQDIEVRIAALEVAMANLVKAQKLTDAQVALLTDVQKTALTIIANIAARLGYADLLKQANDAIAQLGGTITIASSLNSCIAASHFYLHADLGTVKPTARCDGNISVGGQAALSDVAATKCAVHGSGTNGRAYSWGNMIEAANGNGWSLSGQISPVSGLRIQNGLNLSYTDGTSAAALATFDPATIGLTVSGAADGTNNMMKLLALPAGGPSNAVVGNNSIFGLRVVGGATRWKISVRSVSNAATDPFDTVVDAAAFKIGASTGNPNHYVYHIPLPKAVTKLGGCTWNRMITVTPVDAANNAISGAQSCGHKFHTFSPVVLDFTGKGMVKTVGRMNSKAKFDLDANGIQEQTGWISQGSALLALDLNANGKIDDGAELFGEATQVLSSGKAGVNGYKALAQYDSNKDGIVDRKDPIFSKLVVWFDLNGDGKSQSFEMKSMASAGMERISVVFKDVAAKDVIQTDGTPEANLVKYTAQFWGPKQCGIQGCASYDVYFGSTESTVIGSK